MENHESNIKIVVDSTGYLDKSFLEENNIGVVPVKIFIDGKDYKENEDISVNELYNYLATSKEFPKTSQPSIQDFFDVYKPEVEKGKKILSIHISEKVSGTINAAKMAINDLKTNAVKVIDSKATIFSIRFLAEHAVKLIKEGLNFEEIASSMEKLALRFFNRFILSDIKYLEASGRINKSEALFGSVLNIKPIMSFSNGVIKLNGVTRGWARAKESLEKFVESIYKTNGIEKIGVMYGKNIEEAKELINKIETLVKIKADLIQVGAAIGNYAGPVWLGVGIQAEQNI